MYGGFDGIVDHCLGDKHNDDTCFAGGKTNLFFIISH